ncbi:MAG: hypothetical protein WKF68_06650 [Daejeonella sp.]
MLDSINTYSQTDLTLNHSWEKAYQDYPELKQKNALINAAQFNTLKLKSGVLTNTELQLQNTYGTFEGS